MMQKRRTKKITQEFVRENKSLLISDIDCLLLKLQVIKRLLQKSERMGFYNLRNVEQDAHDIMELWESRLEEYIKKKD